jgi:chorismate mutase
MTTVTTTDHTGSDRTGSGQAIPASAGGASAAPVEISALRARIDEIDSTMIALWRERSELSQEVGKVRLASGGTRLALAREREILDRFRRELGAIGTQLGLLILRAGRGPL